MRNSSTYCLVMAGGKGTRFWPESTSAKPKQYLTLSGQSSLIAQTLNRFDGFIEKKQRYIVTVEEQAQICSAQTKGFRAENGLIFEPAGRNTAPCILLSLLELLSRGASREDIICVVPADHVILNTNGFQQTLSIAIHNSLTRNVITTIGVRPHFPHTGYGYIKRGIAQGDSYIVDQFREKPNKETAMEYLKSGQYYWNAGMFVAPIGIFLDEISVHAPTLYSYANDLSAVLNNKQKLKEVYVKLPQDSIDIAVMEKSSKVNVVEARFDWNDLGSWDALESVCEKIDNNILISKYDKGSLIKSNGNIIFAPNQYVSLAHIDDHIIVSNDDVLMILPKSEAQKVKDIYQLTKSKGMESLL